MQKWIDPVVNLLKDQNIFKLKSSFKKSIRYYILLAMLYD